jgi:hypothetical protein
MLWRELTIVSTKCDPNRPWALDWASGPQPQRVRSAWLPAHSSNSGTKYGTIFPLPQSLHYADFSRCVINILTVNDLAAYHCVGRKIALSFHEESSMTKTVAVLRNSLPAVNDSTGVIRVTAIDPA